MERRNGAEIDPQITDVLLARKTLEGRIRHTPTERSAPLSQACGGEVYLKLENQQLCGSFKVRGALNRMERLTPEERRRGVVTASSGNHAQGVALAAVELGVAATVCVPGVCPETKKQAILTRGGSRVTLKVVGHYYDDAESEAARLAREEGLTYLSSFEDPWIIAGAGTLGLELFFDQPDLDLLLVPAGGGGLINGVAIAAKALRPEVEIWGVQSTASMPWVASWPGGTVVDVTYEDSLADGLMGYIPQSLVDLAKKRVSGFLAVEEKDIARAMAFLHREHHQVVEGSGAVGVAALLAGKIDVTGRRVGVVISGGNVDEAVLLSVLGTALDG